MDNEAFVRRVLALPKARVTTLWKAQPGARELALLRGMLKGAQGPSDRFARRTLLELWGVHGRHEAGKPMIAALGAHPHAQKKVLHCERWLLRQRLHEAFTLLEAPVDYEELFLDLLYFGPQVQRQWRLTASYAPEAAPKVLPGHHRVKLPPQARPEAER